MFIPGLPLSTVFLFFPVSLSFALIFFPLLSTAGGVFCVFELRARNGFPAGLVRVPRRAVCRSRAHAIFIDVFKTVMVLLTALYCFGGFLFKLLDWSSCNHHSVNLDFCRNPCGR